MGREQQAVRAVHALIAAGALRPWLDMACPKETQISNARQAALLFHIQQPALEQRLLDPNLLDLLRDRRGEIDLRKTAVGNCLLERVELALDGLELEDDGLAQRALRIGNSVLFVGMDEAELTQEPVRLALAEALEDEQPAVVLEMLADRAIAAGVLHVPRLALTVVVEDVLPVLLFPVVPVAVLRTGFPGEEDDERRVAGRGD